MYASGPGAPEQLKGCASTACRLTSPQVGCNTENSKQAGRWDYDWVLRTELRQAEFRRKQALSRSCCSM
jgi:hypothetical protein